MRKDRILAIQMRRQGKTYNEINRLLGIPKSTMSGWFNDLVLPIKVNRRLWSNARKKWAQSITDYNKKRSRIALENAQSAQLAHSKEIGNLSKRELMLLGTALYWAEGGKKERWRIRFSNSDPAIIALIMRFFREVCKVREDKFIAKVHIYPNISERRSKLFWSKITNIPIKQFGKTFVSISISSKQKRPANTLPHGTLHIDVTDVNLANRIKGWILGLSRFRY